MANTTSGTTTFDKTFSIDEIIEESFERIGLNSVAGYQMKSARRSLNILFQEWGNRGIHYWEIGELDLDLIAVRSDATLGVNDHLSLAKAGVLFPDGAYITYAETQCNSVTAFYG